MAFVAGWASAVLRLEELTDPSALDYVVRGLAPHAERAIAAESEACEARWPKGRAEIQAEWRGDGLGDWAERDADEIHQAESMKVGLIRLDDSPSPLVCLEFRVPTLDRPVTSSLGLEELERFIVELRKHRAILRKRREAEGGG